MVEFGRLLVIMGLALAFCGVVILVANHFIPWLGNLPGDIRIEGENYKIYFPLASMILLNIILRIIRR